jgi:hypothetical protein
LTAITRRSSVAASATPIPFRGDGGRVVVVVVVVVVVEVVVEGTRASDVMGTVVGGAVVGATVVAVGAEVPGAFESVIGADNASSAWELEDAAKVIDSATIMSASREGFTGRECTEGCELATRSTCLQPPRRLRSREH